MTAAFDGFMRQYEAQGREKAEGYMPSHFAGMTGAERRRAADLLYDELSHDAGMAADGLVMLDRGVARERLTRFVAEQAAEPVPTIGEIYARLYELTRDLTYQTLMIEAFSSCPPERRGDLVLRLDATPSTLALRAFLRDRILNEDEPIAQSLCARALLLRRLGAPKTEAERADFTARWANLKSPDAGARRAALDALDGTAEGDA